MSLENKGGQNLKLDITQRRASEAGPMSVMLSDRKGQLAYLGIDFTTMSQQEIIQALQDIRANTTGDKSTDDIGLATDILSEYRSDSEASVYMRMAARENEEIMKNLRSR